MTRIAVAGFQHETNTHAPLATTMADFRMVDSWPGLLEGEAMLEGLAGTSLPAAGAIARARRRGDVGIVPILWASAEPSGRVEDAAFDEIAAMLVDGVAAARADAVCLDLHGAMVTESCEDGEGELLARLRAALGPHVPIVASLDLHANVSERMVAHATALTCFRTYPHLDMARTGARAMDAALACLGGFRPALALRRAPFTIPMCAQNTMIAPLDAVYARIAKMDASDGWAELALGFPAAEVPCMGPAVFAYATDQARADAMADETLGMLEVARPRLRSDLLSPDDAVARAMAAAAHASRPVVIADVQDNPGGGASSDTTGLLRSLVKAGARRAVIGMINDPGAAALAHREGRGAIIETALGGRGTPGDEPFRGRFTVEALSDGRFPFTGRMYAGGTAEAGPCALIRVDGRDCDVAVIVSSRRCQALDRACFAHLGVVLEDRTIVVVKSTIHHRADFEPIAAHVIDCRAPGLLPCG